MDGLGTTATGERFCVVANPRRALDARRTRMTVDTNSFDDKAAETSGKVKKAAKAAVADVADSAQSRLNEAIDMADRNFREAARRIEIAMRGETMNRSSSISHSNSPMRAAPSARLARSCSIASWSAALRVLRSPSSMRLP